MYKQREHLFMNKPDIPEWGKSEKKYHIEIGYFQYNHEGERICGDVFLSKRLPDENRVLCVLSDGMGHGVRANVLATLTSTISLNFTIEHKNPSAIASILMKALPVCSERLISYATYTIVDVSAANETVSILEYDNPQTLVMRGKKIFSPEWEHVEYEGNENDERKSNLKECSFAPQIEDRIIFCSDGITQSGLGKTYALGWGQEQYMEFVRETIDASPTISASSLAERIVKQAYINDAHTPKDDMTCGVVYFREPRKTLLCTGPPFNSEKDHEFAAILNDFSGKKIVSGATTVDIIARELGKEVIDEPITDPALPQSSVMEGVDLVTEGVLTLTKVIGILNKTNSNPNEIQKKGPAERVCDILLDSDEIYILVGTKINVEHHDPELPVDIELRKILIQRLASVLSDKFMKVVNVKYM